MKSVLSKTQLFTLLADSRQRLIIDSLDRSGGPTSVTTLVESVVDNRPSEDVLSDAELRSSVRHVQIPALMHTGLVTYDPLDDSLSGDPNKIEFLREIVSSADHVVASESS